MKILAKFVSADTQIYTGKCYFLGFSAENSKTIKVYNVEVSTSAASANLVGYVHEDSGTEAYMLPKPGVECSNGIYVTVDSGDVCIYYSVG